MSIKSRSKDWLLKISAALLITLWGLNPALAATYTWDGGAGTNNWADGANWNPDKAGGPEAGDDIVINIDTTLSLGASRDVNSLAIDAGADLTVSGGGVFSLTTASLSINNAASVISISQAGDRLIVTNQLAYGANDISLSGTGSIQVQGANSIVGTGAVSIGDHLRLELSGNQTFNYIEDIVGTTDTIIALSNSCTLGLNVASGTEFYAGVIQGDGNLNKLGAGDLVLVGLSTYTGSTTVSAGVLGAVDVGVDINQLPDTTDLIIASGAICVLDDQDMASLSGYGRLHITNGTAVYLWGPGNHVFNGTVTEDLPAALLLDSPGVFTINGTVATDLEIGRGTVVLNGTVEWDIYGWDGILKGTGNCMGALGFVWGTFMPGNSIGTFTVDAGGALGFLDPLASLVIEVNGDMGDHVVVNGPVDIFDGILAVTGVPTKDAEFMIIECTTSDAINGIFTGLPEGSKFTRGGYEYKITYVGGDGNDVVLTALTGGDPGPTPPTPQPPAKPKITKGTSPNPTTSLNGPVLTWPKVRNADSYLVYRAECPTCTRSQISQVKANSYVGSSQTVSEDTVSFVDTSALVGQAYYYWIRAENSDGISGYSNWMVAWRYEQNPGRAGDFNGDGVMDLLWWDPASNNIQAWYLRGGEVWSLSPQGQGLDISQWLLMGTGDFNGDGLWDLVWWNPGTGEVQFWCKPFGQSPMPRSGGFTKTSASLDNMTGNGTMAYPGDLNGDGRTDILWRDYATGEVTVWLMGEDGKPQLDGPPTPADPGLISGDRPGVSGGLDWQAGGLADANGNGKADVFWRNAKDNRIITWFMDGSSITDLAEENMGLDLAWRLRGLGDLNGDNLADIAWRNQDSGEVKAWLMTTGMFSEERIMVGGSSDALKWRLNAVADFCGKQCDDVYCKNIDNGAVLIMSLDGQTHMPH